MPKIRGIKPDFWTDEDVVELSIPARLLFIGMWNFACDNGHLDDKPRQLKMRIFPGDEIDVEPLLRELVDLGRITRFEGTITIRNFALHQKPHKRWWTTCDLPGCSLPEGAGPQGATVAGRHATRKSTVGQPLSTVGHGGSTSDGDGDVDGEVDLTPTESGPRKRGSRLPDDWVPDRALVEQMRAECPYVDQQSEHRKFVDYWRGQPGQRGVKLDWPATYRNWIRRSAERAAPRQQQTDDLFSRAAQRMGVA